MTTADYLESLQSDLSRTVEALDLEEGTTFTDIADMAEDGDIGTGGGADLDDYFTTEPASVGAELAIQLIKKIPPIDCSDMTSLEYFFDSFSSLEEIELSGTEDIQTMSSTFNNCGSLQTVTINDTGGVSIFDNCFNSCTSLITAPSIETYGATNMDNMFYGCYNLTNVPVYGTDVVETMQDIFSGCPNLSNTSLDNILQMCINTDFYTGTKTLAALGFTSSDYSTATIQALPHYQDFIDAGWTIGY